MLVSSDTLEKILEIILPVNILLISLYYSLRVHYNHLFTESLINCNIKNSENDKNMGEKWRKIAIKYWNEHWKWTIVFIISTISLCITILMLVLNGWIASLDKAIWQIILLHLTILIIALQVLPQIIVKKCYRDTLADKRKTRCLIFHSMPTEKEQYESIEGLEPTLPTTESNSQRI
ncbi:MAG: hypothetical protein ACXQS3_04510 [Candidatus Methanofastidiosia archaeon]